MNINMLLDEMIKDIEFVKSNKFYDTFNNEIFIEDWTGNQVLNAANENFILDKFDVMNWLNDYKSFRRDKIINNIIKK